MRKIISITNIVQNMEKLLEFDHHRRKLGDFVMLPPFNLGFGFGFGGIAYNIQGKVGAYVLMCWVCVGSFLLLLLLLLLLSYVVFC